MCVVCTCEPEYLAKAGMLILSGANQFLDGNVLHPTHDASVHLQSTEHIWAFGHWVQIMCIDQHRQHGAVLSLEAAHCGSSTWLKGPPATSGPIPPGTMRQTRAATACLCPSGLTHCLVCSCPNTVCPTWPDLVEGL